MALSSRFRVLVVGAGLGGLTLAQSLCRHGVDVTLAERDRSPWDRPQGYRLHLDADDARAVFEATAHRTAPYTTVLDTDLSVRVRIPTADGHDAAVWPDHDAHPGHANVDRATLRQVLLAGLDDVVTYGRPLVDHRSTGDGVVVHFADGSTETVDVLVGADGVRSTVRAARAPLARVVDAGITAIYGRVPVERASAHVPPETLQDIFTIASDPRKVFLGTGAVRFPESPAAAAAGLAPGLAMRDQQDYVVCIVGGRHEYFPDGAELRAADAARLQEVAASTVDGWGGPAAALVRSGDPDSFFLVGMSTSVPFDLGTPSDVTLLGDAVHAMTPTLGRGANLAMRDGALLGRALAGVARDERALPEALAAYERDMAEYGFRVVREAAAVGAQRMAQNPLPE